MKNYHIVICKCFVLKELKLIQFNCYILLIIFLKFNKFVLKTIQIKYKQINSTHK